MVDFDNIEIIDGYIEADILVVNHLLRKEIQ